MAERKFAGDHHEICLQESLGPAQEFFLKVKGTYIQARDTFFQPPKRNTQVKVVPSRSDCRHEDWELIKDSGASLPMVSKNARTSDEREPINKSRSKSHRHHSRERKGRVDGRGDNVRLRFGRLCQCDAVGRFTSSAISGFIVRRNGATPTNGKWRISILCRRSKNFRV